MSKEKHMVVEINGGEASATMNAETSAQENGKVESSNKAENKSGDSRKNVPLSKLFGFADGIDVLLMIMGTIGAIVTGLGMPAMTVLFGSLVDSFGQNFDASQISSLVDHVFTTGIRFVYLGVVIGVGSFFEVSCWMCTGERQATRIRSLYLETILRQDIKFFDTQTSTGEVVATLAGDTALIQDAMGDKVGTFLQLMTTFFGGLIVALVRGWKLALVLVATTPLLICGGTVVAMVMTKASSRGQQAFEAAGNIIEQTISAIRTVASFGGEKKAIKGYDSSLKPAYITAVQTGLAAGFGLGFLLFAMYSSYALALWYGSRLIINEGYTGGRVINVIFAVLTGGMSLSQASPSVDAFAKGQAAAYKMFQTFKRKPEIDAFDKNGLVMENIQGDIEFKYVYFSYPARPDVQIFSNFSLSILKGSTTAIVGESGSGKSTVINLIERFYDPQAGEVLIDGIDIKKFQLKWIREKIGLVSQEPVLFATTIKDNIAYGKEGATLEEIQLAAEIANAAKFIRKMPLGFETLVGEHGSQLSGGQKQRIAIARAILKDPRILLLDEATSALDAESERKVQNALDNIMLNRTTVVVAHRLTTVKNADTIVVVQRGTIVEKGSHSQLMSNPLGAYFQLMSLQEMNESKEQVERCSDHIDMPLDEARIIDSDQNPSSRALSFRKSQSSRSSRTSGNQPYDGLEDVDHGNKTFKGDTKQANIFRWFARTKMEDMETGRSEHARNVPLLRLAGLNQPEIPVLLAGSISAAIVGLSFPFFGLLFSHVIYSFFEPPEKLTKHVRFWSFMFLVLATTMFVMAPIQKLCFAIAGGKLVERIRSITFKNLIYQEIAWFDDNQNSSGALVARLSTDAAIVRAAVGDALSLLVQNIATITAGIIISFTASWKLALLILALFPLFGLHGWIQVKFLKGFSEDAKMKYEQASHVASEAVGSIRTVASFCAEEKVLKLYNEKCKAPLKKGTQMGILSGVGLGFSNFAMYSSYTLMFWVGSRMVKSGETTFGDVFRVFFAITMTALGVSKSMGMAPDFGKVQTSVNSVFNILDRKSKIDASDDAGEKIENVKGDVQVCHVNFSYPSRKDVQVFRDLNIFFPCGKTVALVGESGSGKSTVIALLQRFYDPDSGSILLDGIDIKKLQVKWLREQMGLVSQEPVLFNDTIRANIAYGKDGLVTEEQIIEAAKDSNAHQFISAIPQGYDTLVGERGIQLSGGQKQRIAIARAIVKDPKILLLDEATSALDAESERLVQDALDHVKLNRTTIVVAHRLSTIKDADVIAVVKNGAIAEEGSHDELLAIKNGAYASLVKLHMSSS